MTIEPNPIRVADAAAGVRARLEAAHARVLAADAADAGAPAAGALARRVRTVAALPAEAFHRLVRRVAAGLAVCVGANAAVGALVASRGVRAGVGGVLGAAGTVLGVLLAMVLLGRWVRVGPAGLLRATTVSWLLCAFIILTGASVRLTGSGLGCPDWPTCKAGDVVPASGTHAGIEFGNRVVTGLCLFAAAGCVLAALLRVPYRRDLGVLAAVVVAALMGNAVLGGITVLVGLKPQFVTAHFVLAIVVLTLAIRLRLAAAADPGPGRPTSEPTPARGPLRVICTVATVLLAVALLLGTLVTGSGPHGGDPDVARYGFSMRDAVRVHSATVWVFLALLVVLSVRSGARTLLRRRCTVMLAVVCAQAAVGLVQWFNRVPALLVFVHVLGAVSVWSVWLHVLDAAGRAGSLRRPAVAAARAGVY